MIEALPGMTWRRFTVLLRGLSANSVLGIMHSSTKPEDEIDTPEEAEKWLLGKMGLGR